MTKEEYAQYLSSEWWQQRRRRAIVDAGHECENCGLPRWVARQVYDKDLNVHHLNYQNLWNEQPEDLKVLCLRHHEIVELGRSDFREIKKAECLLCRNWHWNIYSDYCDICRSIIDTKPNGIWWNLHCEDQDGTPLWRHVLPCVLRAICSDVHFTATDFLGIVANATLRAQEPEDWRIVLYERES